MTTKIMMDAILNEEIDPLEPSKRSPVERGVIILTPEEGMMGFDYKVWREGNSVFYNILNGEEEITKRSVEWDQLGFFTAIFLVKPGQEKCIEKLFKLAHKLARKGIEVLEEQQKL